MYKISNQEFILARNKGSKTPNTPWNEIIDLPIVKTINHLSRPSCVTDYTQTVYYLRVIYIQLN